MAGSEGQPDLARCQAQAGTDFQPLQADRRALGLGERRTSQPQPTQAMQQDIGEGREVQPQLVRPQGGTAGAIGEQSQLLLLDPTLPAMESEAKAGRPQ